MKNNLITSNVLFRAIEIAGGQSALARKLSETCGRNVRQGHIFNWLNRDKQVPAEYAIPIELVTDSLVTRHELRPDIYPPPDETVPKQT